MTGIKKAAVFGDLGLVRVHHRVSLCSNSIKAILVAVRLCQINPILTSGCADAMELKQ